ncbi:MAG: hypothetical protein WC315_00775 [Candidatus Omnitrophota bacterium]|jgi:hypothetical protein
MNLNPLRYQLMTQVESLIRGTETLLADPQIQSRILVAVVARDCLIRQLFWGEQLLATLRDEGNYYHARDEFNIASRASEKALNILHDFHNPRCS